MMNQAKFPVRLMCRLLRVSKSGFYAWEDRPLCERKRMDRALMERIHAIHERSDGAYGSPNIHAELADDHGVRVGRKRVARLMRSSGLERRWIWCNGASTPKHRISFGWPMRPSFQRGLASCT
jgi:putative transposase